MLGQFLADSYHDFCKSGKDRTGLQNIAEAGMKIDQGDKPTGHRYHEIHY